MAVEMFQLNVANYPASSNVYDSLGEAYMVNGDRILAIDNYENSLVLDPDNENAKQQLEVLKGQE
jgi:cytochrome c-type biogenesis protein CcmH/NrfG